MGARAGEKNHRNLLAWDSGSAGMRRWNAHLNISRAKKWTHPNYTIRSGLDLTVGIKVGKVRKR